MEKRISGATVITKSECVQLNILALNVVEAILYSGDEKL